MSWRNWLDREILTRVVVHTADGVTVDGLLEKVARDGIVLRNVNYLDEQPDNRKAAPPRLQGLVFIPRDKVAFVQVMRSTEA